MGITIKRKDAEDIFLRALQLARSERALPKEWIDQTNNVAAAESKTFTAVLGTALLAKATDRHIHTLALREDAGHKGWSARSLAKEVLVPCCKRADIDIRTTGAEPLNNQPFLRANVVSPEMKVRPGTEADLEYLCQCLELADFLENETALAAFAAFLRARIKASGGDKGVAIEGKPLAMARLVESTVAFVAAHIEGGKVGQALVAAILDLVFEDVRTRKVNDPGRKWPGDVGAFVAGKLSLSVEVKQRAFTETEVVQFVDRLATAKVSRGLVAALAQGSTLLATERLSVAALKKHGLLLDVVVGARRLLLDTIRYIDDTKLALLPTLGLKRLKEIEASEKVQRAWVEATTEQQPAE